jgi:hypothetical protein
MLFLWVVVALFEVTRSLSLFSEAQVLQVEGCVS